MHACLHTFIQCTLVPLPVCLCGCVCVYITFVCVWLPVSVCVCVFHVEHCLLETLSKSPQCDNWLPGVLVSLLLIIIIPSRKEKKNCVCV